MPRIRSRLLDRPLQLGTEWQRSSWGIGGLQGSARRWKSRRDNRQARGQRAWDMHIHRCRLLQGKLDRARTSLAPEAVGTSALPHRRRPRTQSTGLSCHLGSTCQAGTGGTSPACRSHVHRRVCTAGRAHRPSRRLHSSKRYMKCLPIARRMRHALLPRGK